MTKTLLQFKMELPEPDLLSSLKQTKQINKIYETTFFKDNGYQSVKDSDQ